jgi:DNA-binding MarR family transcriptional regulator
MACGRIANMNDTELLGQAGHISDIFTRIMLKVMTEELTGGSPDEVTMAQYQALRHIAQHGSCTIGSLAEGLAVSQPAVTMLVDRMIKRDLVDRQPGRSDRRQAEVFLTSHAKHLLDQLENARIDRLGKILELMAPEERRRFVESLESFVSAALSLENVVDGACLRCGIDHRPGCVVNQAHLERSGVGIEKT